MANSASWVSCTRAPLTNDSNQSLQQHQVHGYRPGLLLFVTGERALPSRVRRRMIPLADSLVTGLVLCVPFTVFVVTTFRQMPRVWLHSLPPDIVRAAGPKTAREVRVTRYVMLPIFVVILPGLSGVSAIWLAHRSGLDPSFGAAVLHLYVVWTVVHAWDFLVIDGLYTAWIDPAQPPTPGTEGAKGWKDYGFHFRSFLKAVLMSATMVVPLAALVAWIA